MLLERSRGAPLVVEGSSCDNVDLLTEVFLRSHRLLSVDLSLSADLPSQLPVLESKSMPQLESITLRVPSCEPDARLGLPELFKKGSFPALEKLSFRGYFLRSVYPIWTPTVTSVSLSHIQTCASSILFILRKLPALQILTLNQLETGPTKKERQQPISKELITLAHLQRVRMRGKLLACGYILKAMVIPPKASLDIALDHALNEEDSSSFRTNLVPIFKGKGRTGVALPIRSCVLKYSAGPGWVTFDTWTRNHSVRTLEVSEFPDPSFSLGFSPGNISPLELFAYFSMRGVKSLCIDGFAPIEPESSSLSWYRFFKSVPDVTMLRISDENSPYNSDTINLNRVFCTGLRVVTSDSQEPGDSVPLEILPLLVGLLLKRIRFRQAEEPDDNEFIESLMNVFQTRREAESPLKKLIIQGCLNIDDNDVEYLKQGVSRVEWDGEGNCEDSDSEEE